MTAPQKCATEGCGGKAKRWGRCQKCGAPPEVRKKALVIYENDGLTAASKALGISQTTIGTWARIAGLPYIHRTGCPDLGLTGREAADASGASYRQVDYWQSSGFIQPTSQPEGGSGYFRRYSPADVEQLRVAVGLIGAGVKLERLREMEPDERARMLSVLSAEGFAA